MDERAKIVRAPYHPARRGHWASRKTTPLPASAPSPAPAPSSRAARRPTAQPLTCIVRLQSLLLEGEAMLAKHKHPDPYILPWRPGGTMYHRNPPPVPEVRADSSFFVGCSTIGTFCRSQLAVAAVVQMCAQLEFSQ